MAYGAIAVLQGGQAPLVLLVEMGFAPVVRVATSAVHLDWGGYTWLGAGPLGSVDAIKDGTGDAGTLRFALSGVPSEYLALFLGQSARNRPCTVRLAVLNGATHVVEDAPVVGTFRLDQITIAGATVGVTAVPMARVFSRPKPLRYTDGDQQLLSAGDRSLQYIVSQATHQDIWPARTWGQQ